MSEALERYYERELAFVQEFARHFARQFPAEAGRLLPDPNLTVDPHAERFIEGFALLAGRIRHKIDTEFPELTESLLSVLYPHLLAPVPSMATAQFGMNPDRLPGPQGFTVPRGTRLFTRPLGKPPLVCRWRTGYPVTLWPVRLRDARWLPAPLPAALGAPPRTAAALVLRLECLNNLRFADLELDALRFFLSGESQMIASLYEFLFNHTTRVVCRDLEAGSRATPVVLTPGECLGQVGFNLDEGLLSWPIESFPGYRLLTELLSFREKLLYLDVRGWQKLRRSALGRQVEVVLFLDRTQPNVEQGVGPITFHLGCTPIVNLFEQSAEPLALTQTRYEYRVVPSRLTPSGSEVQSIDSVTCLEAGRSPVECRPFYSFTYDQRHQDGGVFWYASRRASLVPGDRGTEVYLTLVDRDFDPGRPADGLLDVRTTCSNRDVPGRFLRGGDELSVGPDVEAPGPVRCLHAPTPVLRPPLRRAAHWRLVAQNALNHVPLADLEDGRSALQEILRLCDFTDPEAGQQQRAAVNRQMIEGVTGLSARRIRGQVRDRGQAGMCRGVEFTLELDEPKYVGTGAFLFACVIERFLGLYARINSFSRLLARTRQAEGYLKKWPPRAADLQLL
ncbi:MAG: type VI secretion system baseplate subunit TssF [Gemmataceae bacterium]|nr:type VI secretion system baseplate subunit TssF [Gemmataceae bacterium]